MTNIEKDFEETAAKINAKVKVAAAALAEANELANEAGLKGSSILSGPAKMITL